MNPSKLYDILYDTVSRIISLHNPCGIQIDKNGNVSCVVGELCCRGCKYLSKSGCTTNCLGCKFGFCPQGYRKSYKIRWIHKLLTPLHEIARNYDLLFIRASKNESLSDIIDEDNYPCPLVCGDAVEYSS